MNEFNKLKELLAETKLNITKSDIDNGEPKTFSFGDPHGLGFFGLSENGVDVPMGEQWNGEVFTDDQLNKEGVFERIHNRIKKNKKDLI